MKNKVCYIFPYYGKFPNYFDLWLESVRHNAHIADFYIITDSDFPFSTIPSNVFLVNISLNLKFAANPFARTDLFVTRA